MPARRPKTRRKRNTGSVATQTDGTFWAIPPAWVDPGRKPRRGFATREEAGAWLDDACLRARRGDVVPGDSTLADYGALWFDRVADSADWAPSTRASTLTRLRMIAGAADAKGRPLAVHELAVAAVTLGRLQDVIASLARRGLSAAVIGQVASILRRILASAQEDGLVTRNVAARLVLPRVRRAEARAWTRAEVRRLLDAALGDPLEPLVWLGAVLGLRVGEILGLAWDDVDLGARTLAVRQSYSGGQIGPPKTRRVRTVSLPEPVWAVLLRHRERQAPGTRWVIPSPKLKGRPSSYAYARTGLARLIASAGIRALPTHTLRHSAATAMLTSRVDPADAAKQLGHANPAVTLGMYYAAMGEGADPGDVVAGWLGRDDPDPE